MEHGTRAVPLGGTARGNQWGKLAVGSASGREQTICNSFFALVPLSRPHLYLFHVFPLLCTVQTSLLLTSHLPTVKAPPDPPVNRGLGGWERGGSEDTTESAAAALVLIASVISLLALKMNIMSLTRHLFSIMPPYCCSVNKTCRRPLPCDSFLFPERSI